MLGPDAEAFRETASEFLIFVLTRGQHWCGEGTDPCRPILARALEEAVADLAATRGADPGLWRWGEAHRVRFPHLLFQFVPAIGTWFGTTMDTPSSFAHPLTA